MNCSFQHTLNHIFFWWAFISKLLWKLPSEQYMCEWMGLSLFQLHDTFGIMGIKSAFYLTNVSIYSNVIIWRVDKSPLSSPHSLSFSSKRDWAIKPSLQMHIFSIAEWNDWVVTPSSNISYAKIQWMYKMWAKVGWPDIRPRSSVCPLDRGPCRQTLARHMPTNYS